MVKTIRQAITQTRLLTIAYRNYDNVASNRQIEPMSLVFKKYTWYLYAYCLLKEDFRLFRVSRIRDYHMDEQSFERRKKSYHEMMALENEQTEMIEIVLKISAMMKSRVEDIFKEEDITVLETGDFYIESMMPQQDWLMSLIFSFGEHVEVLEPKELRQQISSKLKLMNNKYL